MFFSLDNVWLYALGVANLLLLVWLLVRKPAVADESPEQTLRRQQLLDAVTGGNERLERELRREVTESARTGRQELLQTLSTFQSSLSQQAAEANGSQGNPAEVASIHRIPVREFLRDDAPILEPLDGSEHPVLLAGDFNEWNSGRLPFVAPATVVSPGLSFHASRPTAALDRFVLGRGLRAVSAHVHHSALAKRASDHLPIVIDIAFTETT